MSRRLGLSILMALVGLVLFAACGSGELKLEDYFAEIEVMDDEFKDRTNAIEFGVAAETEEEELRNSRESIESITGVLRDFVDDLDTLSPPSLVADAHEESVRAGRDLVQRYVDLSGQLNEADTVEEFGDLLVENNDLGPAVTRFQVTCDALVEVAAENGLTVDFNCGDEEA